MTFEQRPTPHFVMHKNFYACRKNIYACIIDCSIFSLKQPKTGYQLDSNEVIVTSINLADELVLFC